MTSISIRNKNYDVYSHFISHQLPSLDFSHWIPQTFFTSDIFTGISNSINCCSPLILYGRWPAWTIPGPFSQHLFHYLYLFFSKYVTSEHLQYCAAVSHEHWSIHRDKTYSTIRLTVEPEIKFGSNRLQLQQNKVWLYSWHLVVTIAATLFRGQSILAVQAWLRRIFHKSNVNKRQKVCKLFHTKLITGENKIN